MCLLLESTNLLQDEQVVNHVATLSAEWMSRWVPLSGATDHKGSIEVRAMIAL